MRPVLPALLLLAATAAAAFAHTPVRPDVYPLTKVLIVSDRQQGRKHLFQMNSDGTQVLQLTGGMGNEATPTYLPDGRILFASDRSGKWQVYRMRADGTGVEALTSGDDNNYSPAAARDGTVVFVSDRTNEVKQLFSVRGPGDEPKQLTLSPRGDANESPVVTEDMQVVFVGERNRKRGIWHMALDGTGAAPFPVNKAGMVDTPAVIPSTVRDPLAYTTNTPTTGMMELPRAPQPRLVFMLVNEDETSHIYRMWFNGDELQRLTDTVGYNGYPVTLKDGRILYTSNRDGWTNVWIMTPDGRYQHNLTKKIGKYNSTR